jgi:hypothetical protein
MLATWEEDKDQPEDEEETNKQQRPMQLKGGFRCPRVHVIRAAHNYQGNLEEQEPSRDSGSQQQQPCSKFPPGAHGFSPLSSQCAALTDSSSRMGVAMPPFYKAFGHGQPLFVRVPCPNPAKSIA